MPNVWHKENTHASVGSSSCYFCANTVGSSPKNHMTEQWENKRQTKAPARANNLRTLCKRFYRCTIKFSIISNTLTEVTKIKYTCAVLCTILNVVRLNF